MTINNAVGLRTHRVGSGRSSRLPVLLLLLSAVLLALAALGSTFAPRAAASADSFLLKSNEQLGPGQRLVSSNGQYVLVMQGDGNLVEYAPGNRPIWASGTNARDSVVRMQSDGNVVIVAPGNRPVWATGTNGNPGATLELQSDANLVVYAQGHTPRWASGSAPSGKAPSGSALGDRIASVAAVELRNGSRNHEFGGYNCNYYSTVLGTTSAGPCTNGWRSAAWCADFARWVWAEAGVNTRGLDAGARSFQAYGVQKGTWRKTQSASEARVGDAVVFKKGNGISHVGLVVAVNQAAGTITIIEGNAGDGDRFTAQRVLNPSKVPVDSKKTWVLGFASPIG